MSDFLCQRPVKPAHLGYRNLAPPRAIAIVANNAEKNPTYLFFLVLASLPTQFLIPEMIQILTYRQMYSAAICTNLLWNRYVQRLIQNKKTTKPISNICELQLLQFSVSQKFLNILKGSMVYFKIIWLNWRLKIIITIIIIKWQIVVAYCINVNVQEIYL